MIDYTNQPENLSFPEVVDRTWGSMAGSSVWLEEFRMYLSVTRVYFYNGGVRHYPRISFMYARLYDFQWIHQENFTIQWYGNTITFPCVLNIPAPYKENMHFYGPEDPRILVEQGIAHAEPVVVFNMIVDVENKTRAMHIHKPFSNITTSLRIMNEERKDCEKNWSPFFLPRTELWDEVSQVEAKPSEYIHFIYDWQPLKILRCQLSSGLCIFVYRQDQSGSAFYPYTESHDYGEIECRMHGGTNFEPLNIPTVSGLRSFVGLPRAHTGAGCGKEALYRPILVLLSTNGTHFYIDYSSEALDFGHSILDPAQLEDVCNDGRILLANSITKISSLDDTMSVSFTVADSTVQVAEVHGVRKLMEHLPQFHSAEQDLDAIQWKLNVTHDVLACSLESASDYAIANTNTSEL